MPDGFVYLASAYSLQPDLNEAALAAGRAAADLMRLGYVVYSPIALGHAIVHADSLRRDDPIGARDWKLWKEQATPFLERCDMVVVLEMDGWQRSLGVAWEIDWARTHGLPIRWFRDGALHEEPTDA